MLNVCCTRRLPAWRRMADRHAAACATRPLPTPANLCRASRADVPARQPSGGIRKKAAKPMDEPPPAAEDDTLLAPGEGEDEGEEGEEERSDPIFLKEDDPMYGMVLEDEDLDSEPPGHRSGYVAVIGKPNAGKSTLINAVVGQKLSIVSYKPQTTRHRIMGIASDKHYQMILFDTPGIMDKKMSKLDERMMAAVQSSIKNSEAIVAVVDSDFQPKQALELFQPGRNWTGPPMAVLLNKADLLTPEQLQELTDWYKTNCRVEAVFAGSALTGTGVEEVKQWAISKLPEGPTLYPKSVVSEQPERFFVAEIIREKIFFLYDQEIPYSTQVQIVEFKERPGAKDLVCAELLVERESQVGIVVGRSGAALKKLGQEARKDIEEFLGRPVFLELSVQVAKDWREDKDALNKFGYFDQLYS